MLDTVNQVRVARRITLIVVAGLIGTVGCDQGDPLVGRAQTVFEETMSADPQYQRYALQIAEGTDSPFAREIVIRSVDHDNFQTALAAVKTLSDGPPAEARVALRQVFDEKRGALKLQAAIALARVNDADALEYLRSQIADPAQIVHIPAVTTVAEREGGEEFLRPLLQKRMSNESLQVRDEAYAALGEIRQPWATDLLIQGLNNERGEERQQAIVALGRTGDPRAAGEIRRFVNTKGLVFATLEALGAVGDPSSAEAVRSMVDSEEESVRVYVGAALWRLGEREEALGVLAPLVESEDLTTRRVLSEQLAAIDDPKSRELLGELARDTDKSVRIAALRSMGEHDSADLQDALIEAADDSAYEVQTLALNILAKGGGPDAIDAIARHLDSENPYVALSASHAVLSIRGRSTPP